MLIIIALFVIVGVRSCNNGGGIFGSDKPKKPDTVFSSHTEYIQQPPVTIPQYIPIQSGSAAPIFIPQQYKPDTSSMGIFLRQYMALAEKHFATNTYNDSITLKDSSGKRVGVVNLEDKISENKFVNRKPSYSLSFPVTTNTVTITKYEPKHWQIYIGGLIEGSQKQVLTSGGLGLLYKSKKDAIWEINAKYNFQQQAITYELGRYWKISFRKK